VGVASLACVHLAFGDDKNSYPFDPKGMPIKLAVPSGSNVKNKKDLTLAGVGMRRKNLFVVEVDIYFIGLNISDTTLAQAKQWSTSFRNKCSLAEHVYGNLSNKSTLPTEIKLSATLRFARGVTKAQFLDAFDAAFKGLSKEVIDDFKKSMGESIGDVSVSKGDEFVFYWMDNGDVAFTKNGVFGEPLRFPDLNMRLLEVYIDPTRTVSPELATCVDKHIDAIVP